MRAFLLLGAAAAIAAASGCVPPPPEPPEADPRVAVYNRACELALEGKVEPAFAALEEAVGQGFGRIGFDHLAADPDLVPLRGDPRWGALLRRLSWNEDVHLEVKVPQAEGPLPLTVEILAGPWPPLLCMSPPGPYAAIPQPPFRQGPDSFQWTTRLDPGKRAAEKVALAVERACRDEDVGRKILLASGETEVRVAWEVLLRIPEIFDVAVLDGPEPPAWVLLDRGREKVRTRILQARPTLQAAVAEALR